jgi:uncharacterized protein (UPF0212 family)
MPYCPVCQSEFREGFTRCNSCDVDLVAQLDEIASLDDKDIKARLEGKELIAVTRGTMDPVLESKELLMAKRIPAMVMEEPDPHHQPGMPKRMVLLVAKTDLEKSIEVLGASFRKLVQTEGLKLEHGEGRYDSCPACGSTVPEDAEECPECGLVIGKG